MYKIITILKRPSGKTGWKIKELIENKLFSLAEAIEFLETREQGKKIDITINIDYI